MSLLQFSRTRRISDGLPVDAQEDINGSRVLLRGCRAGLDAGADGVILQPTEDDSDAEGFVWFAASEVAPLLA